SRIDVDDATLSAVESIPAYPGRADYQKRDSQSEYAAQSASVGHEIAEYSPSSDWVSERDAKPSKNKNSARVIEKAPTADEVRVYQELMQTPDIETNVHQLAEP
ncbi:DNA mismatch repair endonuclease MutL, partial [Vibrio alfacsensis]